MNPKKVVSGLAALAVGAAAVVSVASTPAASLTNAPYPRLILTGQNIADAAAHAQDGGRTQVVYEAMKNTGTPSTDQTAADLAFVHRVEHQLYGNAASDAYGQAALKRIYGFDDTGHAVGKTQNSSPATIWGGYGNIKMYAGEEIIPVVFIADWTDDLSSSAAKTQIRQWLCEFVNLVDADLAKRSDFSNTHNYYAQNIAAEGLALMYLSASSQKYGSCTLSLHQTTNGAAQTTEARITQLVSMMTDQYYPARLKNGYFSEEGTWYETFSLPEMGEFLAAAGQAGYTIPSNTAAVNVAQGLVERTVSNGFFQWGDAAELNMLNYKTMFSVYAYYLKLAGNRPGDYYVFRQLRQGREGDDLFRMTGNRWMFVTFFDDSVPSATPTALSAFNRDNLTKTPEPIGGWVSMRESWDDGALALRILNRGDHGNHQHFDPSSMEIIYGGEQFVIDHTGYYSEEQHGEAIQQSTVIYYDTAAVQWGNLPTNDGIGDTSDDSSAFGQIVAYADKTNVGAAVYSDHRYALVNQVNGGVFAPRTTITPAPTGRRLLLFLRQAGQPPIIAVYDRDGLGASKDWRVQWHISSSVSPSGTGTVSDPLVLEGESGKMLYAFVSDGRQLTEDANRVYGASASGYEYPDTWNRVYYTQQSGTAEPIWSTVFFPSPDGAPTITLETLSGRNTYKIQRPGTTNYARYVQNQTKGAMTVGRVTTDAEAFILSYDAAGNVLGGVFANYTTLTDNGANVGTLTGTRVSSVRFLQDGSNAADVSNSALTRQPSGIDTTDTPTPTPTNTATWTPSPTATDTPTATPTNTPTPASPPGLWLNEVHPNPSLDWNLSGRVDAGDAWVEIKSNDDTTTLLWGWRLQVGAAFYPFPASASIGPLGYKVIFAENALPFPASGTLQLINPQSTPVSTITYPAQTAGYSYAPYPDVWGAWASGRPATAGYNNAP